MPRTTRRSASTKHMGIPLVIGAGISYACRSGDDQKLPKRILIARWGANEVRSQGVTFNVGLMTVQKLAATQKKKGWDTVSLDFEHQSIPGHPNYKEDPKDFAAHGHVEVVSGQGVYYVADKYTPAGITSAAGYPDVSGFFILDPATREVIGVHSVALCQHGEVPGAEFVEAIAAAMQAFQLEGDADVQSVLSFARELCALGEDATPADLAEALEQMVRAQNPETDLEVEQTETEPEQPMNTTTTPTIVPKTGAAAATAENDRLTRLETVVGSIATSMEKLVADNTIAAHNRDVEGELTLAASQGKKIPEGLKKKDQQGRYTLDAPQVKEIIAAIPVTESVNFTTPEMLALGQRPGLGQADKQAETAICAAIGVKLESFEKGVPIIHGNQPMAGTEKKFTAAA